MDKTVREALEAQDRAKRVVADKFGESIKALETKIAALEKNGNEPWKVAMHRETLGHLRAWHHDLVTA